MTGSDIMRVLVLVGLLAAAGPAAAQDPTVEPPPPPMPMPAESPGIKLLTGLTVPEFEGEMRHFVESMGASCTFCHMPRGNFASDEKPQKVTARRMIEMTRRLNQEFFPGYTPAPGESTLGRVTCYTCHQGSAQPKAAPRYGQE